MKKLLRKDSTHYCNPFPFSQPLVAKHQQLSRWRRSEATTRRAGRQSGKAAATYRELERFTITTHLMDMLTGQQHPCPQQILEARGLTLK